MLDRGAEARAWLDTTRPTAPEAPELLLADADWQRLQGQGDAALALYREAVGRAQTAATQAAAQWGLGRALQERGDAARRTDLAHEIHVADIDAQLQRRGRHQHLQLAGLELLLGIQPQLLGQRAVVRGDVFLAQQLAEVARGALGHAPGVDEHQRGRVLVDELGEGPGMVLFNRWAGAFPQVYRAIHRARVAVPDSMTLVSMLVST